MPESLRILIVDDEPLDRQEVIRALQGLHAQGDGVGGGGVEADVREADTIAQAREALRAEEFACVFLAHSLPDGTSLDLLLEVRSQGLATPVIVLTGKRDEQIIAEVMRAGAIDYLPKEKLRPDLVARSLRVALRFLQVQREKEVALAELRVRDRAIAAASNGIVIADLRLPDCPLIYTNGAFLSMTGYAEEEVLGRNCRFLQGPDTDPAAVRELREAVRQERPCQVLILNYRKDGSAFWNEVTVSPVRDARGTLTHFVGVQSDISERIGTQEALRAATTRLATLIAGIQAGVIVEDDGGQLVLTNQAFCVLIGLEAQAQALVGANVVPLARRTSLLFADSDGFLERALHLRREQQPVQAEPLELADGRVWERDYVPVLRDGNGGLGGHLWLFRDMTERRKIEQQVRDAAVVLEFQNGELERTNADLGRANAELARANARLEALATTDGLTNLLNHRVFEQRLSEEFFRARRYGEPLSLIVLDVDRFKTYNDTFGHLAGNEVLRKLAEVLREHARETDIVVRFGGEEFALILPHTEAEEAAVLAERLRSALEQTVWSAQYPITASFGVCALTPELDGPDALVACADAAMYRAKAGGRNQVVQG